MVSLLLHNCSKFLLQFLKNYPRLLHSRLGPAPKPSRTDAPRLGARRSRTRKPTGVLEPLIWSEFWVSIRKCLFWSNLICMSVSISRQSSSHWLHLFLSAWVQKSTTTIIQLRSYLTSSQILFSLHQPLIINLDIHHPVDYLFWSPIHIKSEWVILLFPCNLSSLFIARIICLPK